MPEYLVSGCIVTHNNIETIRNAVDSILKFTQGVDFKLFIVDNNSDDGTLELLKTDFAGEKRLEIIALKTNFGFSYGQNFVLPLLKSKYHIVINPDVELHEDAVTKMAEYMEQNEDVGLLSPKICFPDGREQILGKRNPKLKYLAASRLRNENKPGTLLREYAMLDSVTETEPFDIENATGCFMMLRTALFRSVGGFDEKYFMYFEDSDITRAMRKKSRAVYFPQAIVYHIWGRGSRKDARLMAVHIKSMLHYFFKWRNNDDEKQEV